MKTLCQVLRNRVAFSAAALAAMMLSTGFSAACHAQAGGDAVVGPGGTSPTAPASNMVSASLLDKAGLHLGKPDDAMTFTVVNKGSQTLTYDFNNGRQFDLVISDAGGKEVWTWSKQQFFTQLITHLKLAPGQSHSYHAMWNRRDDNDKPVPAGTYRAVASLTNLPRLVVAKTTTLNPAIENRDPTNVTVPSPSAQATDPQSGGMAQSDTAPSASAKTTIEISAEE